MRHLTLAVVLIVVVLAVLLAALVATATASSKGKHGRLMAGVNAMYSWDWGFIEHEHCYTDEERGLYICYDLAPTVYSSSTLRARYRTATRTR